MSIHALAAVLVELAAASTALERTAKPSPKDVKEAKASTKKAADLLGASETFLSYGIYTVAEEPKDDKYADPNDYRIEMPEVDAEVPVELKPMPEILALFATWGEEEQLREFEMRLDALSDRVEAADDQAINDYDPWDEALNADRTDTFLRLVIAGDREPASFTVPTDEERDAWLREHGQLQEQAPTDEVVEGSEEPAGSAPEDDVSADELFQQKLDELEEAGVKESGLKRKTWKKTAEPAWRAAYSEDPTRTLDKILWRLQQSQIAWDVPSDEEVAA